MVILLLLSVYPHYYSWWMFINYYNDEYYEQYWHQVFFFVTEMCSTLVVLSSVNKETPFTAKKVLIIVRWVNVCHNSKYNLLLDFQLIWTPNLTFSSFFSIAALHILLNGTDQFIINIFLLRGELHQVLRDFGLMLPDLLHVVLPIIEYQKNNTDSMLFFVSEKKITNDKIRSRDIVKFFVIVLCLWFVGSNI